MTEGPSPSGGRRTLVAWALVLLPALALLIYISIYGVNGPEWDHVWSTELFERFDRHVLTLPFLFGQHNEHRTPVSRLAILALGELTRWNNRAEQYAHWALMCVTAAVLYAGFRREASPGVLQRSALLTFAPIALVMMSPRSYDPLLGFGLPHYLAVIGLVGALCTLAFARPSVPALAGAIACGLVATFSLSNGLLIWPIGLLLLLCDAHAQPPRGSRARAMIWAAVGAVTIVGYLHGYTDPGNHSSPWFLLEHPRVSLFHYFALNGSPLAPGMVGAVVVGGILVALEAACVALSLDDCWRRRLRPPAGVWLIAIVLISCALVSMHRAGFGIAQAIETRYVATSMLGVVGLYWCLVARRRDWPFAQPMMAAVAALMVAGYLYVSIDAWEIAPRWYARKSRMAYLLYSAKYQPTSILDALYTSGEEARRYSSALERLRFNVFAEDHVQPGQLALDWPQPEFVVEDVNAHPVGSTIPIEVGRNDAVTVDGWAFNGTGSGPARAVFLTIDGRDDVPAQVGVYRPRLGGAVQRRYRRWGGFSGSFGGFVLAPGEHVLTVKVVSDDGRHAYVSEPIARLVRR
jgi:hypothetical protein